MIFTRVGPPKCHSGKFGIFRGPNSKKGVKSQCLFRKNPKKCHFFQNSKKSSFFDQNFHQNFIIFFNDEKLKGLKPEQLKSIETILLTANHEQPLFEDAEIIQKKEA